MVTSWSSMLILDILIHTSMGRWVPRAKHLLLGCTNKHVATVLGTVCHRLANNQEHRWLGLPPSHFCRATNKAKDPELVQGPPAWLKKAIPRKNLWFRRNSNEVWNLITPPPSTCHQHICHPRPASGMTPPLTCHSFTEERMDIFSMICFFRMNQEFGWSMFGLNGAHL